MSKPHDTSSKCIGSSTHLGVRAGRSLFAVTLRKLNLMCQQNLGELGKWRKGFASVGETGEPVRRTLKRIWLPAHEFAYVYTIAFTLCMMEAHRERFLQALHCSSCTSTMAFCMSRPYLNKQVRLCSLVVNLFDCLLAGLSH